PASRTAAATARTRRPARPRVAGSRLRLTISWGSFEVAAACGRLGGRILSTQEGSGLKGGQAGSSRPSAPAKWEHGRRHDRERRCPRAVRPDEAPDRVVLSAAGARADGPGG